MKFKDYWKITQAEQAQSEILLKSADKLTVDELMDVRQTIAKLQERGYPAYKIIEHLQNLNKKLAEKWKAERAYWTESKRIDTKEVAHDAEELGFNKYRVVLSPNACKVCREKAENGAKIFTDADLKKSGYGHIPPFHPNCYCILLPKS